MRIRPSERPPVAHHAQQSSVPEMGMPDHPLLPMPDRFGSHDARSCEENESEWGLPSVVRSTIEECQEIEIEKPCKRSS